MCIYMYIPPGLPRLALRVPEGLHGVRELGRASGGAAIIVMAFKSNNNHKKKNNHNNNSNNNNDNYNICGSWEYTKEKFYGPRDVRTCSCSLPAE